MVFVVKFRIVIRLININLIMHRDISMCKGLLYYLNALLFASLLVAHIASIVFREQM